MKFRKKPVVIDAIQWLGYNEDEIFVFARTKDGLTLATEAGDAGRLLSISTLEGKMIASVGDWIIKGVKGEFYPCKPDIFELTYELVEEAK
jgi:hypothetical protein